MIRVVFDANVLASGFAGSHQSESIPGQLVRLWSAGAFELVISDHLRGEVLSTFREPYFRRRLPAARLSRAAALLRYQATNIPITARVTGVATHPEDDLVLATAVSAHVDYLVTGDAKLQRLYTYAGVLIVSPREFLGLVRVRHVDNRSE